MSKHVETAEMLATYADQLAAVVDSMIETGKVTRAGLAVIRDSLGEIHVEADQLAEGIRGVELGTVAVPVLGVAA